ncbi:hypothetical protein P7K49_015219 [Saguinus oedipus]|uniref:Uncharacterized protein n=1 Tax=Saguinus oedipus TaxID=9490 RepID=A0ABQ9V9F9_SAGOE|nr:hypothetical protein P7K49_015219 [Saguinus oedipus]
MATDQPSNPQKSAEEWGPHRRLRPLPQRRHGECWDATLLSCAQPSRVAGVTCPTYREVATQTPPRQAPALASEAKLGKALASATATALCLEQPPGGPGRGPQLHGQHPRKEPPALCSHPLHLVSTISTLRVSKALAPSTQPAGVEHTGPCHSQAFTESLYHPDPMPGPQPLRARPGTELNLDKRPDRCTHPLLLRGPRPQLGRPELTQGSLLTLEAGMRGFRGSEEFKRIPGNPVQVRRAVRLLVEPLPPGRGPQGPAHKARTLPTGRLHPGSLMPAPSQMWRLLPSLWKMWEMLS